MDRNTKDAIKQWQKFYAEVFHLNHDFGILHFTTLQIQDNPGYRWDLIIEYGDLTLKQVFEKCQELFKVNCDFDINDIKDAAPWTAGNRAYWLQWYDYLDEEAFPEYYPLKEIDSKKIIGITLKGRLLQELFIFWSKGYNSDEENDYTVCWGSRLADGSVPTVAFSENMEYDLDENNDKVNVSKPNPALNIWSLLLGNECPLRKIKIVA